jgi:hypothetical protein
MAEHSRPNRSFYYLSVTGQPELSPHLTRQAYLAEIKIYPLKNVFKKNIFCSREIFYFTAEYAELLNLF